MKFYMMTDLEGVAGVYTWENRDDESLENHERRYRQRRWLAGEVSAAAEGLFEVGADKIIVNDGHGAGYSIDLDHVDPRVEIIHGQDRPFWLPFLDESCDATGIVGGHAKAGTPNANLCHTMSGAIREWRFNDIALGEMGIQAAIAGHYGVPFVFCTGDAYACKEMGELIPGCVTVPVKWGTSRLSTMTMPPVEAQERIREGALCALDAIDRVEPFDLGSPVHFRDERHEPTFDEEDPGDFTIIDAHTREVEAENIIELMYTIYDYPRDWSPLSFTPAWKES